VNNLPILIILYTQYPEENRHRKVVNMPITNLPIG